MNKIAKYIFFIFLILLLVFIFLPMPSIAKKIENDKAFKYSTSITGNYSNSDRANVYTTNMSVPDTAAYIIREIRPESYTDLSNEDQIQLVYDDYYILIYKGEGAVTYVQVSSRKFVHRNGYHRLYRPFNRNIIVFYDRSYRSRGYYRTDNNRYGGGYSNSSSTQVLNTSNNGSKIRTDKNASSKIRTDSNSSSKIKTKSSSFNSVPSSKSIRTGSSGTRTSFGGGTSFGK
ncbi:hypothetical protein [Paramaledivibacter caminithermalis]|jgi:hypothetical protein|uniref:DUF4247 domain-containing protein n=1 Tax=Paramaledivibacter caminithermalis (strain DSM 15212 / CIP 107654 / DViRD3) TaxID=1121301 RepID=A0A1M6S7D7_PARC5|nr:hypothetical protein [Paramaledivibacter caminithermalis]SHK40714.1 hypothetical protein SAMN02745912_03212 [Paramaledivibacter caminithermalis DSM 15212]